MQRHNLRGSFPGIGVMLMGVGGICSFFLVHFHYLLLTLHNVDKIIDYCVAL